MLTGEGGGGERGAKSYERKKAKKAWSSIYHSILYGVSPTTLQGGKSAKQEVLFIKTQSKDFSN